MPKVTKARAVEVEIYDQRYSIIVKSGIAENDVRRLAEDLDARMRRIANVASTADSLKIAILAALHISQELQELRKDSEANEAIIRRKSDEWTHALEELLRK